MNSDTIDVELAKLESVVGKNLAVLGLSADEANVVAEVLMYAELRDKSQGLIKIVEKSVAPDPDRRPVTVDSRSPAIHLLKANGHAGMVVLNQATSVTIEACRQTGLALTGTLGTASSSGSIGFYAERIARAGLIGIVMAGSPKVMAVADSRRAALGTNPVAFGIPTRADPLVFDMATAATTWFDLVQSARDNTPIAKGLALDAAGQPTVDAAEALKGVMLTFGGSKGSGLALMFEMLTGPLMGAALVGDEHDSRGNFMLAINPTVLVDDFAGRVEQVLDAIREGPLQTGHTSVRLPGERSAALARERLAVGSVPVKRDIYAQLLAGAGG